MEPSVDEILRELGVTPAGGTGGKAAPVPPKPASEAGFEEVLKSLTGSGSGPEKPRPAQPPVQTGKISIDVDAIRAEQPRPRRPIPANPEPPVETPPKQPEKDAAKPEQRPRPADKVREHAPIHEPVDPASRYAPAFRGLGQKLEKEPPAAQMDKLRSSAASAILMGGITLLIAALLLGFAIFLHIERVKTPGQMPSRVILGIMTGLAAAAGGLGWPILASGARSFLKFEPNREILPVLGYSICLLQSVGQLLFPKGLPNENIQFYVPVGVLLLAFGWLSRALVFRTAAVNGKLVFSDYDKYVPQVVSDSRLASEFTKGLVDGYGVPVINRRTDLLGDFLPISFGSDRSDMAGRNLAVAALIIGGGAGLFTYLFTQHKNLALTVMTAIILVFSPLTNLFCTVCPLRRSARVLSRVGGLAAGERCTVDSAEVNAAVIDAKDLLPPDCVTLSGIKTFEGMRLDEAILDSASVLVKVGSVLSGVFLRIISGRTDLLREVDSVAYEDGMGLSAWVGKKRVLIGNRELMLHYGVRVPSEEYERKFREQGCDLVYLGSAGELTAVFILTLRPSREADEAIQKLLENDILLSIRTVDAIVTGDRLAELYLCDTSYFKILPARLHEKFEERRQLVKVKPASLANNGSFGSMTASLVAARRVKVMMTISGVIQMVSILLGAGLVLMLALLGAMVQFSAPVLSAYLLLWLGVDLLVQRLVRI